MVSKIVWLSPFSVLAILKASSLSLLLRSVVAPVVASAVVVVVVVVVVAVAVVVVAPAILVLILVVIVVITVVVVVALLESLKLRRDSIIEEDG